MSVATCGRPCGYMVSVGAMCMQQKRKRCGQGLRTSVAHVRRHRPCRQRNCAGFRRPYDGRGAVRKRGCCSASLRRAWRYALLLLATAVVEAQEFGSPPPLRLVAMDYALYAKAIPFRRDHSWHDAGAVRGVRYFGRLAIEDGRAAGAGVVTFAVEEVGDGAVHRYCASAEACDDMALGVVPDTGQLYLYTVVPSRSGSGAYSTELPVADFEPLRAEVSAEDESAGLKVYREIVVDPPSSRPDCGGYPADDVDRFTCLFLGEHLPSPDVETPESVREALPALVQPHENYRLVLAEEFDGVDMDRPPGCAGRHVGLDTGVWSYNACPSVDADDVPCLNVADGQLFLATTGVCGSGGVTTAGKFAYRYGYAETRLTFKLGYPGYYVNHAMVLWAGGHQTPLRHLYGRYGVVVDDYETAGKYLGVELDFAEVVPKSAGANLYRHQYLNERGDGAFVNHRGVGPKRGDKLLGFCRVGELTHLNLFPPGACGEGGEGGEVTATLGLEWTPRGYRSWLKVDGVHDGFVLMEEEVSSLSFRRWDPIDRVFSNFWSRLNRRQKAAVFDRWTDGERSSRIEGFAVAHVPADVGMAAWGHPAAEDTRIRTWLKVDYIRIFQPANGYRDMEPIYN